MDATLIEWLIGVIFLGLVLLLIAARIRVARRNCGHLRDAHWLTGTASPVVGGTG